MVTPICDVEPVAKPGAIVAWAVEIRKTVEYAVW
jgi:hypothetical protein